MNSIHRSDQRHIPDRTPLDVFMARTMDPDNLKNPIIAYLKSKGAKRISELSADQLPQPRS